MICNVAKAKKTQSFAFHIFMSFHLGLPRQSFSALILSGWFASPKKAWTKRARALTPSQKEPVPTSLQDCRNSPDLPCNHATTVQPTSRLQVAWLANPTAANDCNEITTSLRPEQKREALPKQSRQWLTIPEAMKFRDLRHCSVFVFTVLGVWSMMKFILNSIGFSLVLVSTACLDQNGTPVWQVRKVTWNVCNAKAKLLAVVTWSAALGPCAAAQSEKEADKRSAKDRQSPTVLRPPTIHDFPVRTGKVQNKYEMARWFCHGFGQLLWNHDKSTCLDHHESWRIMNPRNPYTRIDIHHLSFLLQVWYGLTAVSDHPVTNRHNLQRCKCSEQPAKSCQVTSALPMLENFGGNFERLQNDLTNSHHSPGKHPDSPPPEKVKRIHGQLLWNIHPHEASN